MNLLLLEPDEVATDGSVRLDGIRARHLIEVLRVTAGDHVRLGVVDGSTGTGSVLAVAGRTVDLRCTFEGLPPPRPSVDLLLALPRPKVMKRLWAQLSALGVGRIMLTNAARVERNYFDTHVLAPDCYRPLLLEGLQQARDTRLPLVTIHRQLKALIEDELAGYCPDGHRVAADPSGTRSIAGVVQPRAGARLLLAVGPEGGWNAFEQRLLAAHAFAPIGMGPRTLRSDTACVALIALAHDALRTARDHAPGAP